MSFFGALVLLFSAARADVPPEIERLLDADPLPQVTVDPSRRYLLLVHERQLVAIERLAEPAVRLAGRRINPLTAAAHAPLEYYGLTLIDLATGEEAPIVLPRGAVIGYPSWAPDGSRFAFTLTGPAGTEVWIGEPREARARPLVGSINAARALPCTWMPDSRRMLCRRLEPGSALPAVPADSSLDATAPQTPAEQPIVLSEQLARHLLESQLELIDTASGQRHAIGARAAFESVTPAPAQAYLLVTRILEPYPRISDVDTIRRAVEIWDRFGNLVKRLPAGVRAVDWHASQPATVTWVERRDGKDRVMLLPPPYSGQPIEGFVLPHIFSGLHWIADSGSALVSDYDAGRRNTDFWRVDFDMPESAPRLVAGYPSASPRSPVTAPNARGMDAAIVHEGGFYLRGETQTGGRSRTFLEHVSLATGTSRIVWKADHEGYETLLDALTPDAKILLTRRETEVAPPNYYISTADGAQLAAVTSYRHPAPALAEARRISLRYTRDDDVELAATLYLPAGADPSSPLPLIVWAYPRNVSAQDAQSLAAERARFPTFERAFRLFFVLRGYAVLDDVSMPVVGSEGDANDTFIEQIVANAEAAIRAAQDTEFVDPKRVGVAGHSYGAFMVANLLAHSRLFAAGVALSGAYNRTLTPFGFQTERRTLWEAPETYLAMSPLLYSHRIEAPLLLVHGLSDDNAGTSPLQSTQFYTAIRGNGGDVELLLLPWEGHSYRARKSVLDTAGHMLEWFDRYLKGRPGSIAQKETGASLRPSF